MKFFLAFLKFLFIGALFIVSNNHLYLSLPSDFSTFQHLYYDWLTNIFEYGKELSGYAVKSQWLPS